MSETEHAALPSKKLRIGLGVITHRRMDGLLRLLESFRQMKVPADVACTVLIAENDDTPTLDAHIAALQAAVPFEVQLDFEKTRGIPFARNRVLDMALAGNDDFLTFVDDDQIVDRFWLVMLFSSMQARELDLVDGPNLFIQDPEAKLPWQNRLVLQDYKRSKRYLNSYRSSLVLTESECEIPIYTNNWMLRMSKLRELGIRFDADYAISGGSDTKFYHDFCQAGAVTGWASDAHVSEIWPASRLTFRYLYKRTRDQRSTTLLRAQEEPTLPRALLFLCLKCYKAFGLLLRSPFNNFRTLPVAIRRVAEGVGTVRAARRLKSQLYRPSD